MLFISIPVLLSTAPANTPLLFPFSTAVETLVMQLERDCPQFFSWVPQPPGKVDSGDAEINQTYACSTWLAASVLEAG